MPAGEPRAAPPQPHVPRALPSVQGPPRLHVRDYARTTLAPRHRAVVRALAEAMFHDDVAYVAHVAHMTHAAHATPPRAAHLDAFPSEVDAMMSPASKTLRFGLVLMLDALRWLPLVVVGRARTFEALVLSDRIRMLERLERAKLTPLTLLFVAYKTILTMLFFEDAAELTAMGYPGAERTRWKRAIPPEAP